MKNTQSINNVKPQVILILISVLALTGVVVWIVYKLSSDKIEVFQVPSSIATKNLYLRIPRKWSVFKEDERIIKSEMKRYDRLSIGCVIIPGAITQPLSIHAWQNKGNLSLSERARSHKVSWYRVVTSEEYKSLSPINGCQRLLRIIDGEMSSGPVHQEIIYIKDSRDCFIYAIGCDSSIVELEDWETIRRVLESVYIN